MLNLEIAGVEERAEGECLWGYCDKQVIHITVLATILRRRDAERNILNVNLL